MGILVEKLHVANFGCIQDQTVELSPLTVLVGPNDSGKTMLLRALSMLAHASTSEQGWRGVLPDVEALRAHAFDKLAPLGFGIEGYVRTGEAFTYRVEVDADRVGSGAPNIEICSEQIEIPEFELQRTRQSVRLRDAGADLKDVGPSWPDPVVPILHRPVRNLLAQTAWSKLGPLLDRLQPLLDALGSARVYALRPEALRASSPADVSMQGNGFGLSRAVADLLLQQRDLMERIEAALTSAMPHVKRVDVKQRSPGNGHAAAVSNEIELITRSGARIPSHLVSDGVLLFLGYLYMVLGPEPASVLMIEEPETGVHPGLLRKLVQLFRDMTTGAHGGPPTQVILTTHSPMLLNLVEPSEIRVVQRGDDGATRVTPFTSAPDLDKLLDYQGPGEIWVNQGEEYLTGRAATT